ncbi:MAG: hypothetical protein HDR97_00975 [Bacteroides sp.]|nr:hypothetical protein [Bacteroides sp.]
MKRIFLSILTVILAGSLSVATADSVDDAVAAARKSPRNVGLNRAAADALSEAGRRAEAIPYYLKSGNAGNLRAAEILFYLYRFDEARDYLEKYLEKRSKADLEKEPEVPFSSPDGEPQRLSDYLAGRIDLGRSMLDRVEKIQIIDSVNVPSERLFEFIRLARDAGRLLGEAATSRVASDRMLDSLGMSYLNAPSYLTERGDELYWTATDESGAASLFESSRLSDGLWDTPLKLFDYSSLFGNSSGQSIVSPFLMPDGVTLYFAADGDDSLGGLDIFISRRDGAGDFLQPSNIGMPYNSPANDYMYAVDETTGAGWWASDRSGLRDSVTIYTFVPQELRINYDVDTPGLADYAAVTSIALTQPSGADYSALRRRLQSLERNGAGLGDGGSVNDFDFALPDGRVLHRLSDFRSSMARASMGHLLKARKEYEREVAELQSLRERYGRGDRSVASEILRRENRLEQSRADLLELSNEVSANEQ